MTSKTDRDLVSLARDFARFAGPRLWLLLALMLAGSIAEGFGLLMIVPLAAIALGEGSSLPAWVAAPFERFAADQALLAAAAVFLVAMALRSLLLVWRESLRARLQGTYQASLQLRAAAILVAHRDSTLRHCQKLLEVQHRQSDAAE